MGNPAPILAVAAEKRSWTHCIRGHEFTPENTIWDRGLRRCRICHCASQRAAYRRRQKAADDIVDEVALERATGGDEAVYAALTEREHEVLVKRLADSRRAGGPLPMIRQLADAVHAEMRRRRERANGLLD